MRIPAATLFSLALSSALLTAVSPPGLPASRRTAPAPAPSQAATTPDQRPDKGPFTLGVLRRDGVIIPFAHFDGRRWSNDWVTPNKTFDVPISLNDVPERWWPGRKPILSWTAWPTQRSSRRIEAQAPVLLRAHCQRAVGLRTNWVPNEPPPPDGVQPYPKEGLATAGSAVLVEPVQLLAEGSPEWKMVAEAAHAEVTSRERSAVGNLSAMWSHPVPEDQRAKTAFEPEVVLKSHDRTNGWVVYYFEGVKRYPAKPPRAGERRQAVGWQIVGPGGQRLTIAPEPRGQATSCDLLSFASGWMTTSPGKKPAVRVNVDITDCNREGLVYTMPLGALRLDGKLVWVLQVSGYGYERYEVVEIQEGRVKILQATPGGACG